MKRLVFLFFLISCQADTQEKPYLPEFLPSEDVIKISLSSDENLLILRNLSRSKGLTLESWKEREKKSVSETEISKYWRDERKGFVSEGFDTDAIDKAREAIRIRLVWSRIFHQANLPWKETPKKSEKILISKLDLESSPKLGVANAKWVIVEWSDFFCNFCKQTQPYTKKILERYKNQILYYHKDYPLDPDSQEGTTPLAISRCLWRKNPSHYLQHVELLYSQAKQLKMNDIDGFGECAPNRLDKEFYNLVNRDYQEAIKYGISSIPTFWVNGRWVVGSLDEKSWTRLLQDTASK